MTKKHRSMLEDLTSVAAQYKHPTAMTWFDRLPEDVQKELVEVRKAIQEGKIYGPRRMLARVIIRMCEDRGVRVCGHQGVETWLRRK